MTGKVTGDLCFLRGICEGMEQCEAVPKEPAVGKLRNPVWLGNVRQNKKKTDYSVPFVYFL